MKRSLILPTIVITLLWGLVVEESKGQYQLSVIAKTGDVIEGKTLSYIYPSRISMNDIGTVAYSGVAGAPSILTQDGLIAKQGSTIGGKTLIYPGYPVLNDTGTVLFQGTYTGGSGIFTQNGIVAQTGDTISGLTLTGTGDHPSINNSGSVAFSASFSGGAGIFTPEGVIAKTGDVIEGLTLTNFAGIYGPVINNSGDMAFTALYSDSPDGQDSGIAIFSQNKVIFKLNSIVDGIQVSGIANGATLNDLGLVAFHGTYSGGDGIFTQNHVIAKKGDIIDGLKLTSLGNDPSLNDHGMVAFSGIYSGGSAVFTQNGLVAKTGDAVEGLTLNSLNTTCVNNNGDIAFYATFTDGKAGIVLAHPIPEPSSLALLLTVPLGGLLWWRRRS